jgi:hypothetical protein
VLVVALLLEEGKDEGVLQLPNFHEIHRNLRSMMKKHFEGSHKKETLKKEV